MNENSLKLRVQDDMKAAMRARDSERLGVIRMLLAAIKQREIDERSTLDESQVISVINKIQHIIDTSFYLLRNNIS